MLSPTLGGEEFLAPFRAAARGELAPFVLVIEGSIPNENINGEGYWTSFGNDLAHRRAADPQLVDRPARAEGLGGGRGRHLRHLRRHPRHGRQPDRLPWGWRDYLGWDFRSAGGLPIVNIPGCPVQPDNFMETLTWLLYHAAGHGAAAPARRAAAPAVAVRQDACTRAATGPATTSRPTSPYDYNSPKCQVKVGCWGPVVNCNVPKRGWMDGVGGCPNVGGICIGCTMPGFPDKFMPFMDEPPGGNLSAALIKPYGVFVRRMRGITNASAQQGTGVAPQPRRR